MRGFVRVCVPVGIHSGRGNDRYYDSDCIFIYRGPSRNEKHSHKFLHPMIPAGTEIQLLRQATET